MQNINYKVIIAIIYLFVFSNNLAGLNRTNFLSQGPSVSAMGRAETGVSFLNDYSAPYYNPANLMLIDRSGVILSHHMLAEGTIYNYLGFGMPYKEANSFSFSYISLKSGDIELRQSIDDGPLISSIRQSAYIMSACRQIGDKKGLGIGINLKYIIQDFNEYKDNAFSSDLGLLKKFIGPDITGENSNIYIGMMADNIIKPKFKLKDDYEEYERIYSLGVSAEIPLFIREYFKDSVIIHARLKNEEDLNKYSFGIEYTAVNNYFFRAGYRDFHTTLGLGYRKSSMQIDYAIDYNSISNFHRFSFGYYFGDEKNEEIPEKHSGKKMKSPNEDSLSLKEEANMALQNAEKIKKKRESESKPVFKEAKKCFSKRKYILASESFEKLLLEYPENDRAGRYLAKINKDMKQDAKEDQTTDLEKLSYAKGYWFYKSGDLGNALNEWDKVLRINPKSDEIKSHFKEVRKHMNDMARISREKAVEEKVKGRFEKGLKYFDSGKWVKCIKSMEGVQKTCKQEEFPDAIGWHNKSQKYIDMSLAELLKVISIKDADENESGQQQEIDIAGADKKYNEGLILYAQGKIVDAVKTWEIAIRLNPKHKKAKIALEKAREELKINKN